MHVASYPTDHDPKRCLSLDMARSVLYLLIGEQCAKRLIARSVPLPASCALSRLLALTEAGKLFPAHGAARRLSLPYAAQGHDPNDKQEDTRRLAPLPGTSLALHRP